MLQSHSSGQHLHLKPQLPSLGRGGVRHLHSTQAVSLPCRGVSEEELAAVVERVDAAERAGALERWAQEDAPTAVMPPGQEPAPGTIDSRRHWPELDITMLELGNGMKVRPRALHMLSGFLRGSCQLNKVSRSLDACVCLYPTKNGSSSMLHLGSFAQGNCQR